MKELIKEVRQRFESEAHSIRTLHDLEAWRVRYLGRKGEIAGLFSGLADVPKQLKPELGQALNVLKKASERLLDELSEKIGAADSKQSAAKLDLSLPGRKPAVGRKHPLVQIADEIKTIFLSFGFTIEDGPEIETDYYNFEALNFPDSHPARDMQDTLFIEEKIVLRTHTSPVQIRTMEKHSPPIRVIAPGRVYRRDTPDASHSPFFHQVEGLVVDKGVTFADLKGIIQAFAHKLFGPDINVRFRPSFFPFTEPSAEYDFSCVFCKGKGCRVCKKTGWMEISGAGMVHPNVFKSVGYDPEIYTGYAFGMGIDRIAMLVFGINDIRIFFENDLRFLNQF